MPKNRRPRNNNRTRSRRIHGVTKKDNSPKIKSEATQPKPEVKTPEPTHSFYDAATATPRHPRCVRVTSRRRGARPGWRRSAA